MKTVSAKLYPTPTQERDMLRILGVTRWIYNRALEHRQKAYKRRGESVSFYTQCALLTKWRARMRWIGDVPRMIEECALSRLDGSFASFFRRVKAGEVPGFPRFKGRDRWRSFSIRQTGKYIRPPSRIYIPGVGDVRYRGMDDFAGRIKVLRVVRRASGWHVQLTVEGEPAAEKKPITSTVGIDVGLSSFATLSTGEAVDNPRWYQSAQRRLRTLQRRVSRRRKGSNRRREAVNRLARFHERIVDTRRDWTHKLSRRIVNEFDLIGVEDLNVKGLSRTRFAKSVLDAAWAEFAWQLDYKAENAGGRLVRVDPRGTTQECSECGAIVPKTLSDRVHSCSCGYVACRDLNAAKNVLRRASAEVTRGESTLAGGVPATPRRGSLNREAFGTERLLMTVQTMATAKRGET